jgi:protein tyrosine phosphatase (PTP) superfamily phosphohydrolase (DUF442 family)
MLPVLLLPAFLLAAPSAQIPDSVQVHPRIWVLRGAPGPATYAALKHAGITHVVNLRRDGEPGFDPEEENSRLGALEIAYVRLAMGRAPSASDLDLFRTILSGLPSSARVLVHCGNGNRAAAAVCGFLVLDQKMEEGKALALAREAGLSAPETEKALLSYLAKPRS